MQSTTKYFEVVFEVVIVQIDDLRTKYSERSAYISMMHWYQGEPNFPDLAACLKSDAELVDEQYLPKPIFDLTNIQDA